MLSLLAVCLFYQLIVYFYSHRQSYEIGSLRQNAEYECLVQARNKFGWSEPSRIFHFFTGKRGASKEIEAIYNFDGFMATVQKKGCCKVGDFRHMADNK